MDALIAKLIQSLTDPVALILLLWILNDVRREIICNASLERLLDAQQERGIVLTKITTMIEQLLRGGKQ